MLVIRRIIRFRLAKRSGNHSRLTRNATTKYLGIIGRHSVIRSMHATFASIELVDHFGAFAHINLGAFQIAIYEFDVGDSGK